MSTKTLDSEETDMQPFPNHHRRRRRQKATRWTPPPFLVWATMSATCSSSRCLAPVLVEGFPHPREQEGHPSAEGGDGVVANNNNNTAADNHSVPEVALNAESEALMGDFMRELWDYSYLHLIIEESKQKAPHHHHFNMRNPPVMIGRRRTLLEHAMQNQYSLQYLQQLREQQKQQQEHEDNNHHNSNNNRDDEIISDRESLLQDSKRRLQEALKVYLYQTPLEAHVKANPQRNQHNAATSNSLSLPPFPPSIAKANAALLRNMFYKSYNAYMEHSFPAAELLPMTCQAGTFDLVRLPALTLIDALDTLLVLGDSLEFAKAVERLRQFHLQHAKDGGIFAVHQNVSVFETTIRVLGGLLSAHQMAVAYLRTTSAVQDENNYSHSYTRRRQSSADTTSSSSKLPPVFLKDLYNDPVDQYLIPTEDVHLALEQHRQRMDRMAQPGVQAEVGLDGTCTVGKTSENAGAENEIPHDDDNDKNGNHNQDEEDWQDHCGAGNLALKDCAVPKSKSKSLNQTAAAAARRKLKLQHEPQWEYDGFLLDLAIDIGERLFPAFDTRTGIPYGTVNLLSGVPSGETTIASLAGGGTLSLEFELLSRLTGDLKYGQAAKLAVRALWLRRSSLNLVGKHIDIQRGTWTENLSGIGSNSDSFLEYLLKHYLLFPEEEDFWVMLQAAYTGIFHDARLGEWYADVDMKTGKQNWPKGMIKRVLESLMAFYPGMQTLMGEFVPAARSLNSFFMVREFLGFLPERFSYANWKVDGGISSGAAKYPLRPELLESCYFMHRVTKKDNDSGESASSWQWAASFALHHLERLTRAKCGYASVRGLNPATGNINAYENPDQVKLSNEMPSFFLSETIKYLYLTFDDDNIIHKDKDRDWIFTTEAHPIHYVPTFEKQQESTSASNKDDSHYLKEVKEKLRKKLKVLKYHRKMHQKGHRTFLPSKSKAEHGVSPHYLAKEQWSDSTQPRNYKNSVKDVVGKINDKIDENDIDNEGHPLRSFFGDDMALLGPNKFDTAESMFVDKNNLAHLTWNSVGLGSGYAMKKACPNIYATELTWLHALNGGALDYTDIYVSAFSEEDGDYPSPSEAVQLLVTSAEALSVHGSGVYLGNMEPAINATERCVLAHQSKGSTQQSQESSQTSSMSSPTAPGQESKPDDTTVNGVQQVELAGLGTFEVSAFPGGSGFFMKRIENGESIMTTFIADPDNNGMFAGDVTLMVYASMPRARIQMEPLKSQLQDDLFERLEEDPRNDSHQPDGNEEEVDEKSPWHLVGPRLAKFFRKSRRGAVKEVSDADAKMDGDPERVVVIADLVGNAFHCEVNIVRRPLHYLNTEWSDTEGDENQNTNASQDGFLVASYPCAPALFGATHMESLIESNGVFIEQTLQAPETNDEFGCGSESDVPSVTTTTDDKVPNEKSSNDDQDIHVTEDNETDSSCENKCIQMVQRGKCSFYSKAANQKLNANADGVIVINSADDELFVMSSGDDDDVALSEDEMPITVLVTGIDGEEIVELIQAESIHANSSDEQIDSYLVAQISVFKQDAKFDASGAINTENDHVDWPIVRATEEHLQIFTEGGWGIHAMRRDGGSIKDMDGNGDLQLFLLKHSEGS